MTRVARNCGAAQYAEPLLGRPPSSSDSNGDGVRGACFGDPTSCAEGARGCVPEMLGVTCMDVSLIATWETLTAQPDAASFLARVESDRTACNPYSANAEQLQALRARVDAHFTNRDRAVPGFTDD